jgi:hypothetical protein
MQRNQLWKWWFAAIVLPILFVACTAAMLSSELPALAAEGAVSTVNILVRALSETGGVSC